MYYIMPMLFVANLFHVMLFCVNCVPHNPAQIFVWQNMNGGGNWIHWSKHFNTPNSTWQAAIKHLNLLNFLHLLLPQFFLTGSYQTLWSLSNYPHSSILHSLFGRKIIPEIMSGGAKFTLNRQSLRESRYKLEIQEIWESLRDAK